MTRKTTMSELLAYLSWLEKSDIGSRVELARSVRSAIRLAREPRRKR